MLQEGAVRVLVLQGDHDLSTTPHVVQQLDEALSAHARLVIDLSDVRIMYPRRAPFPAACWRSSSEP